MSLAENTPADVDRNAEDIDLSALFQPLSVSSLSLSNRFVMPGMQRGWCIDGHPAERLADYYAARVRGGVQLIISECIAVDHPSAGRSRKYGRLAPDTAAGWAKSVQAVHQAGGRFFVQIGHEGALLGPPDGDYFADAPVLSPSGLSKPGTSVGRAATFEELQAIKDAFARSAAIARDIGADGVEIHVCHGYLLDEFLWTATNKREDRYGGASMRERASFPAEVIQAVREAVGRDFVISVRISQWKLTDYDARSAETPVELATLLQAFSEAGADLFHASNRRFGHPEWPGSDLSLAGWTRRLSDKPVIAVGGVGLTVDMVETFSGKDNDGPAEINFASLAQRFAANEFDLIAVGRSIIADADWVAKVRDRRFDLIRQFQFADLGDVAEDAKTASAKGA